ncbi:sugar ABC transporter substrate-binding protein [Carboxydothermus pertinax]|uniref:Lipoprotein n=1 Tax=Carboxydothermus pertinax TaxID=870242 RepID=A0A1L8CV94_9THEO|nr:sugar ABC transporter substrate-binding protein [Carboxydothermus pertinax]GAV22807.1 hypothetical protein cpu_13170 [Carboxydothermus pertinax]
MKKALVFFLAVSLIISLTGCPDKKRKPLPPKIFLMVAKSKEEKDLIKTFEAKAKEKKWQVMIKSLNANENREEKILTQITGRKPKGVIWETAGSPKAGILAQKLYRESKIIFLKDIPYSAWGDGAILLDYKKGAELMAKNLALYEKTGKVLLLAANRQKLSVKLLEESLMKELTALGKSVTTGELLVKDQRKVLAGVKKLAEGQSIIALDGKIGELLAEVGMNKERGVIFASMELTPKIAQAIYQNKLLASIDPLQEVIAAKAVEEMDGLLKNRGFKGETKIMVKKGELPVIYTPVRLVTRENIEELQKTYGKFKAAAKQGQDKDNQKQGKTTRVKITTSQGKTIELTVEGEITRIETGPEGGKEEKKGGTAETRRVWR